MRFNRLAALVVAAALVSSCSDDDDNTGPDDGARVRVVHASADAPNVDVLVDDDAVVTDLAFGEASDYLDVAAGDRDVQVVATGTTDPVIEATLDVEEETDYTIIAANELASIEPIVLEDDNSPTQTGQFRLRLIHASPSAGPVDIYVTEPGVSLTGVTPDFSAVTFGGELSIEAPAGTYQVRITPAGSQTVAFDSGALALATAQVRTAIAVDTPGGGAPVGVILLADLN